MIQLLCSKKALAQVDLTASIQRVWGSQGALYMSLLSLLIMLCIMKSLQKIPSLRHELHIIHKRLVLCCTENGGCLRNYCRVSWGINSYVSLHRSTCQRVWLQPVVNPSWIAPQCKLFFRCTGRWEYSRAQQLTRVSSPLLSLQKPVCVPIFQKGGNWVEGLRATGRTELGCCFSAPCSLH